MKTYNLASYDKTCKLCKVDFQTLIQASKTCVPCKEASPIKVCKQCKTNTFKALTNLTGICEPCTVENSRALFIGTSKDSYCECAICGHCAVELVQHLKVKHGMSAEEYSDTYNLNTVSVDKCAKVAGDKNPAFNHGGKFSPFSKKFVGYEGLTDDEKEAKTTDLFATSINSRNERDNNTTRLSYYTSRGATESEAMKMLAERQSTFSLDICIEKYGVEEGTRTWNNRQDKWLDTLDAKPVEDKVAINAKKAWQTGLGSALDSSEFETGRFYVVELPNGFFKIGMTKRDMEKRYDLMHRADYTEHIVIERPMNVCYMMEQILKKKLNEYAILPEEIQEGFGWTETFKNITINKIRAEVDFFNSVDIYKEYEKFCKPNR